MSDTPELPQLFTDVKRFNLTYPIVVLSHMAEADPCAARRRSHDGRHPANVGAHIAGAIVVALHDDPILY